MTTVHDISPSEAEKGAQRATARETSSRFALLWYLLAGALFGMILVKSEVASWFRIQEMFRFQSFHMYGILGSAFITAAVSVQILTRFGLRTFDGEAIALGRKEMGRGHRYWLGGAIFGLGWALTGACPGPLFALVGTGAWIFVVTILAALAGTLAYGILRPRLPH